VQPDCPGKGGEAVRKPAATPLRDPCRARARPSASFYTEGGPLAGWGGEWGGGTFGRVGTAASTDELPTPAVANRPAVGAAHVAAGDGQPAAPTGAPGHCGGAV
jgi:hypothetical protein